MATTFFKWFPKGHVDTNVHDHIHLWQKKTKHAVCTLVCVCVCVWTKAKTQRTKGQHCSKSGQLLYMSGHVAYEFQEISVYFANLISCYLLAYCGILVFKLLQASNAACSRSIIITFRQKSGSYYFHSLYEFFFNKHIKQ